MRHELVDVVLETGDNRVIGVKLLNERIVGVFGLSEVESVPPEEVVFAAVIIVLEGEVLECRWN